MAVADDLPVVSIAGPVGVTQGHDYTFTVSSVPPTALTVPLTVSNTDSVYTGTLPTQADIPAEGSVVITLTTQEVAAGNPFGDIQLSPPGAGARYTLGANTGLFPVFHNNNSPSTATPSIAIAADSTDTINVRSATEVGFTLTASHQPDNTTTDVAVVVSETGNFIASTFDKTQNVRLAASGVTTPFKVAIADDDPAVDAADSVITVSLRDGTGYTLVDPTATPNHTDTVTVSDDVPILGELSIASLVDETFLGGDILYTVTLDPAPTGDNTVSIAMEVSDTGSTGDLTLHPATLEIGRSGTATGRVRVGTTGTFGARTPVQVKISDNSSYTFNPQMVDVPMVDVPSATSVSISGPSSSVAEGDEAVFSVGTASAGSVDLVIGVSVADLAGRGDYVTDGTEYVVLESGQLATELRVSTTDVAGASLDGVIVATLQSGVGYDTPATTVAYANVYDGDETKEMLVVRPPVDADITEGEDAVFVVARTGTSGLLTYRYDLTVVGDLYDGMKEDVVGTIADGDQTDTITITTKSLDALLPSNAGILLRLQGPRAYDAATYRFSGVFQRTVAVADDLPVVSVAGPVGVTQGHDYTFTVSSVPPTALTVPLTVSNTDGVYTGTLPTQADIPAEGSVVITLTTQEVAAGNPFGDIQLSPPGAGARYTLGANTGLFPVFHNNNSPSTATPSIAIAADSTDTINVRSATEVGFTLTASHQPDNTTTDVAVVVSETGNFIASTFDKTQNVRLVASGVTTPFKVAIADDDPAVDAADSVITVSLRDGTGYTLVDPTATPNHTDTVTITDDAPVPVVSITGLGGSVTQGSFV